MFIPGKSCFCPSLTFTYLKYEQEKEVGIGYFLELLEQVDGQKGDDVVLGCHNAVTLEKQRGIHHMD